MPFFELIGSGMGNAYTDTKTQKIDSKFFGLNNFQFYYSAGILYDQLGICEPSNIILSESEQVFSLDIRILQPPGGGDI